MKLNISNSELDQRILEFGKNIFSRIGESQPSAFQKSFWAGNMMEWSMQFPKFKTDMFRLVDVLPALRDSTAIASHVQEYLAESARELNALIAWGVNVPPKSLRAKATSLAVKHGVSHMAQQFIAGETPTKATRELKRLRSSGLAFTVDLLGEYCLSEREALAYFERYREALMVFSKEVPQWKCAHPIMEGHPGESTPICVSVKLSALYSQCYALNMTKSVQVLSQRLGDLIRLAAEKNIQVYIDAEDTSHNPIIYRVFKSVFGSEEFRSYPYPGIVVQAYAKESESLLRSLLKFAEERGNPIAVRLVKGAYWDAETVQASQKNWENPLFEEKHESDRNFETLTRILFDNIDLCLPALGSHNIRSLVHGCCYAEALGISKSRYELQMLFGMAEPIARAFQREGRLVRL
ncbi:MAG: proline dehydrogenase family protein, partial [Bdellovibrionales bacterium]|nr:proline dehydrogenase family protein [Bdellovibrionales bacterium]